MRGELVIVAARLIDMETILLALCEQITTELAAKEITPAWPWDYGLEATGPWRARLVIVSSTWIVDDNGFDGPVVDSNIRLILDLKIDDGLLTWMMLGYWAAYLEAEATEAYCCLANQSSVELAIKTIGDTVYRCVILATEAAAQVLEPGQYVLEGRGSNDC